MQRSLAWLACYVFFLQVLGVTSQQTLLAYYSFDNTALPNSGICPLPPYLAAPEVKCGLQTGCTTPNYVSSATAGFNQAFQVHFDYGITENGVLGKSFRKSAVFFFGWLFTHYAALHVTT